MKDNGSVLFTGLRYAGPANLEILVGQGEGA